MSCISPTITPSIASARANAIPVKILGTDNSLVSLVGKTAIARFRPPIGTDLNLSTSNGIDSSNFATGDLLINLTSAQIADWPFNTAIPMNVWVFNADQTPFARGSITIMVQE